MFRREFFFRFVPFFGNNKGAIRTLLGDIARPGAVFIIGRSQVVTANRGDEITSIS